MTKQRRGRAAYRKGRVGETKAQRFLTRRGFKLITDRFRTKKGELDRIMRDPHNRKVAVEVKNLSSPVQAAAVRKFASKIGFERKHGTVSGGVIVSKSGYSDGAAKVARQNRIKLMKYTPPKKKRRRGLLAFL
jgi:RecB family endonuclease NucS